MTQQPECIIEFDPSNPYEPLECILFDCQSCLNQVKDQKKQKQQQQLEEKELIQNYENNQFSHISRNNIQTHNLLSNRQNKSHIKQKEQLFNQIPPLYQKEKRSKQNIKNPKYSKEDVISDLKNTIFKPIPQKLQKISFFNKNIKPIQNENNEKSNTLDIQQPIQSENIKTQQEKTENLQVNIDNKELKNNNIQENQQENIEKENLIGLEDQSQLQHQQQIVNNNNPQQLTFEDSENSLDSFGNGSENISSSSDDTTNQQEELNDENEENNNNNSDSGEDYEDQSCFYQQNEVNQGNNLENSFELLCQFEKQQDGCDENELEFNYKGKNQGQNTHILDCSFEEQLKQDQEDLGVVQQNDGDNDKNNANNENQEKYSKDSLENLKIYDNSSSQSSVQKQSQVSILESMNEKQQQQKEEEGYQNKEQEKEEKQEQINFDNENNSQQTEQQQQFFQRKSGPRKKKICMQEQDGGYLRQSLENLAQKYIQQQSSSSSSQNCSQELNSETSA